MGIVKKPKIYCFSSVISGEHYAIAEDGTVLGSHWCSHESFVPGDLGTEDGTRSDRHEIYSKHYPDGYEIEFVPSKMVKKHDGLARAIDLYNERHGEQG